MFNFDNIELWKSSFWFMLLTGIILILIAFIILLNPYILIILLSALLIYAGIFFIGAAFLIRKFGRESDEYYRWNNAKHWFWQW